MWKDALLVMLSCTLFVQMGLADAVQHTLHIRFRIMSCPKCASFWCSLFYLLAIDRCKVIDAVAVSFLFSYLSLWLALAYDALASLYNRIYEQFTEASGVSEDAPSCDSEKAHSDEMPEVHNT